MRRRSSSWYLAGAASLVALYPACAAAQLSDDAGQAYEADVILVTARKRTESIVDVPISISARAGDDLDNLAIRDIGGAAGLIPNLYIDEVPAGPRVSIRGLATSQTGGVVDSSVGLGIDGLFYGRPRWISIGLFDLEAIEVLRGPQSTYFGKNTTAGFINIRTKSPGDVWEGRVAGGYEFDIGGYNVEAAAGGPINDSFGVRLAYRHLDRDGYISVAGTGQDDPDYDEHIARATLAWTPTDNFNATYKFTYFDGREEQNGQEIGACDAA
ncbi:MAG: TonB-dependent receptor plug domain-containing protein, partial [Pseudomonadota bacterium]